MSAWHWASRPDGWALCCDGPPGCDVCLTVDFSDPGIRRLIEAAHDMLFAAVLALPVLRQDRAILVNSYTVADTGKVDKEAQQYLAQYDLAIDTLTAAIAKAGVTP